MLEALARRRSLPTDAAAGEREPAAGVDRLDAEGRAGAAAWRRRTPRSSPSRAARRPASRRTAGCRRTSAPRRDRRCRRRAPSRTSPPKRSSCARRYLAPPRRLCIGSNGSVTPRPRGGAGHQLHQALRAGAETSACGSKPDSAFATAFTSAGRHAGLVGGLLDHVVVRRRRAERGAAERGAAAALGARAARRGPCRTPASTVVAGGGRRQGRDLALDRGDAGDGLGDAHAAAPRVAASAIARAARASITSVSSRSSSAQAGGAVLVAAPLLELARRSRAPAGPRPGRRGPRRRRTPSRAASTTAASSPSRAASRSRSACSSSAAGRPAPASAGLRRAVARAARSRPPPGRARAWRCGRRAPSWRPSAGPPAGRGRCRV